MTKPEQHTQPDYMQPVAYDAHGRPLYAHPPSPPSQVPTQGHVPQSVVSPQPHPSTSGHAEQRATRSSHVTNAPQAVEGHNFDPQMRKQWGNEPDVIHATRSYDPNHGEISDELKQKHEDSLKKYPELNLSKGEFVIKSVTRHPIGLFTPIAITGFIIIALLSLLIAYPLITANASNPAAYPDFSLVALPVLLLIAVAGIFGYIAVWVYMRNFFYLTNESIIQEIQLSLFTKREQTVSLGSVEDVSYFQTGIIQAMFNYGSIRLSTEGEETTYRFYYVENPKEQAAILNNAVEAYKNGRAVEDID